MLKKIDRSIFEKVETLTENKEIDALLYTNNLQKARQILKEHF